MHRIVICAVCSVFLTACASSEVAPNVWQLVEPDLVRDWCITGEMPTATPAGWPDCSTVTRDDAERLAAHKRQVDARRAGGLGRGR